MVELKVSDRKNPRYSVFNDTKTITIQREPLLNSNDRIFLMGSCFAEEIRIALSKRHVTCLPDFTTLNIPVDAKIDELPERQHMNFYNTFTVLQEVEKILGIWQQNPDDYWTLGHGSPFRFQDPYRRLVMANDVVDLRSITHDIDGAMSKSFNAASAFIFTFGMAEVFRDKRTGRVVSQKPAYFGDGGLNETIMHQSSFAENLENIRRLFDLINAHKPGCPIFVTVSPVPLQRTFSSEDVYIASFEGKCVLRAALGEATRLLKNVHYFPSFEFIIAHGSENGYRPDGRHVRRELIASIVETFLEAYLPLDQSQVTTSVIENTDQHSPITSEDPGIDRCQSQRHSECALDELGGFTLATTDALHCNSSNRSVTSSTTELDETKYRGNTVNKYKIKAEVAQFARKGVEQFEGMLNKSAAVTAASALTILQQDLGWQNRAFLEIGVFKGKFFSLVENATKGSDCRLIGVDPFELPGQSKESVLKSFSDNGMEMNRIVMHEGYSTDVAAIKELLGDRQLTLCHIDGSHKEDDVYRDFHTINNLASEDAIVIGDDFWNKSQLGVTTAIFRFVIEDKIDLKPFMISNTKLYLCREGYLREYKKKFSESFEQNPEFTLFQEWAEKRKKAEHWHTEQKMSRFEVLLI
ncbi:GSCFA domain-containing protein [Sinorhizobium meliloti]|uniref:GSCFA domain-containing protein n=1 Tax=Rhizobium meliloti TaxID=382 RepID=UPI0018659C28